MTSLNLELFLSKLGFSGSSGSVTSNEANKSVRLRDAARRVDNHSAPSGALFGPNKIYILSQNTASRILADCNFFQVQAIKTGLIWIMYRQTSDILLVSSKGTALQLLSDCRKFQDNVANTAGTDSKISQ